jgi:uncharacterized protein YjfI (DUF2170 family)
MNIEKLQKHLLNIEGNNLSTELLSKSVLKVTDPQLPNMPALISVNDIQVLCKITLMPVAEFTTEQKNAFNEVALTGHLGLPLSAIAIDQDCYVVYGELSSESSLELVTTDIEMLFENTKEVIELIGTIV